MIKLNGGDPLIICDRCRVVIRSASSRDSQDVTHLCPDCIRQLNKTSEDNGSI